MSWRKSALGRVHWYDCDELGHVSRCGKSRPDILPPAASPTDARCERCALLYAGRVVSSVQDPEPHHHHLGTKAEQLAIRERNEAIRHVWRINPGMPMTEIAVRFGTTTRIASMAVKRKVAQS